MLRRIQALGAYRNDATNCTREGATGLVHRQEPEEKGGQKTPAPEGKGKEEGESIRKAQEEIQEAKEQEQGEKEKAAAKGQMECRQVGPVL